MKLDLFLLADAATAAEGKLFIHGGGFTRINVPALPWTQGQLVLAARFAVVAEDASRDHKFTLRLLNPDGEQLIPTANLDLQAANPPPEKVEGEEMFLNLTLTFGPLVFEEGGVHRIEIDLDGRMERSMPLPVVVAAS